MTKGRPQNLRTREGFFNRCPLKFSGPPSCKQKKKKQNTFLRSSLLNFVKADEEEHPKLIFVLAEQRSHFDNKYSNRANSITVSTSFYKNLFHNIYQTIGIFKRFNNHFYGLSITYGVVVIIESAFLLVLMIDHRMFEYIFHAHIGSKIPEQSQTTSK